MKRGSENVVSENVVSENWLGDFGSENEMDSRKIVTWRMRSRRMIDLRECFGRPIPYSLRMCESLFVHAMLESLLLYLVSCDNNKSGGS